MEPLFPQGKCDDMAKRSNMDINLGDIPTYPRKLIPISSYGSNVRDKSRRYYLQNGPCQLKRYKFPVTMFGKKPRRFNSAWLEKYDSWLEYNESKDAAFCLYYYLFKPNIGEQGCSNCFVGEGYSNWKKNERFDIHVGGPIALGRS